MNRIKDFVREKTGLALFLTFTLGALSFFVLLVIISSVSTRNNHLAVLSPMMNESVSGIVPIRAYFKTSTNPFILSAEFKVDDGLPQDLQVTRVNDKEVVAVGAWDSTLDPGKHTVTVTLFKASKKQGDQNKTIISQSKIPVAVLLFQK